MLALVSLALANGQSTHVWISAHAVEKLPEGELKEILSDPTHWQMLMNGTMFPDGGYGPADDVYGEYSHWEPFQDAYRAWIVDNYSFPLNEEGQQHLAFYMGLASHGMADQTHDAMYMERAHTYDADSDWANTSMDTATDVECVADLGGWDPPDDWAPYDLFVDLMMQVHSHEVSADLMRSGQRDLRTAIAAVALWAAVPDTLASYRAQWPWATENLQDSRIPGSVPTESDIVADYWQHLWGRMQGDDRQALMGVYAPTSDDPAHVDGMVSVVFTEGLLPDTVSAERFAILDENGTSYPVSTRVFYGHGSHVVNLTPSVGLPREMDFELTVKPGIAGFAGSTVDEDLHAAFSTRTPVEEEPTPAEEDGGCRGRSAAFLLILPAFLRRRRCS